MGNCVDDYKTKVEVIPEQEIAHNDFKLEIKSLEQYSYQGESQTELLNSIISSQLLMSQRVDQFRNQYRQYCRKRKTLEAKRSEEDLSGSSTLLKVKSLQF
ncbi:unnamed protein product [Blepharisma stoltei]|uniref:Uncharacterized protein n=1 Tax=Blepharisma stoltei TaxID=1481888 RepID=A0AAU9K3W9_9CILI|nr:unnamed protein product [Blepharisma stoltei]